MATPHFFRLPNGLTTILLPDEHATAVATNLSVTVGSRFETPKTAGVAHYLEHIVSNKTQAWEDKMHLEFKVESQGMYRNAYTWSFITAYWFEGQSTDLDDMLEYSRQIVFESQLDEESVTGERGIIIEEWKMGWDDPSGFADTIASEAAFPNHQLSMQTIGTKETIQNLQLQDFLDYYQKYYVPNNALLVIAGKFDLNETKQKIETLFGKYVGAQARELNTYMESQEEVVIVTGVREIPHTIIRVDLKVPGPKHADWWALNVLFAMCAEGNASLYQQNLVNTHKVITDFTFGWHPNTDVTQAMTELRLPSGRGEAALKELIALWSGIKQGAFAHDVERAKNILTTFMALDIQEMSAKADTITQYYHLTGSVFDFEDVSEKIAAVQAEDVQRVAQKYLIPSRLVITVVSSKELETAPLHELVQTL